MNNCSCIQRIQYTVSEAFDVRTRLTIHIIAPLLHDSIAIFVHMKYESVWTSYFAQTTNIHTKIDISSVGVLPHMYPKGPHV